jgi:hypothetical protein
MDLGGHDMSLLPGTDRNFEGWSRRDRRVTKARTGAVALVLVCACMIVLLAGTVAFLGVAYSPSGGKDDPAASIQRLQSAIADEPNRADLYLELADLYMSADQKDLAAANRILADCVAVNPGDPAVYLRLGAVQMMLGHNKAALRTLEEYQRLTAGS